MSTLDELHDRWSRNPDYRQAYGRLEPEFELARALIKARTCGHHPSGVGREDEDDAVGGGAFGERSGVAIDVHP